MEAFVHIKAQASDWHPDNPNIRPSVWSLPIILLVFISLTLIVDAGAYINGNGMPFLS